MAAKSVQQKRFAGKDEIPDGAGIHRVRNRKTKVLDVTRPAGSPSRQPPDPAARADQLGAAANTSAGGSTALRPKPAARSAVAARDGGGAAPRPAHGQRGRLESVE